MPSCFPRPTLVSRGGMSMTDRVGEQLGKYQITRLLGTGGFAEVYLGVHVHLGTEAAIKLLHAQLAGAEEVEKFRREAQTIATLLHPNIVRVLDFDVERGTPYLVMDYAPNGSLRQRLPQNTPLAPAAILPYLAQIGEGLQYAHDQRFIHRDIKPENMLLGRRQEVLLTDFGIALVAQSGSAQSTQAVAGTAAYMAPEQLQGKPRQSSDLYSLGVVVYEWLTGERPFQGTFTEVASQHVLTPPPPLRQKVPTLSRAIEHVVLTALAKDPRERFGSVRAFVAAFTQEALAPESVSTFYTRPALPASPANSPEAQVASWHGADTRAAATHPTPPLPQAGGTPGADIFSAATHLTPPVPPAPQTEWAPGRANQWSMSGPTASDPAPNGGGWGAMPAGAGPLPGDGPTFPNTGLPPAVRSGPAAPVAPMPVVPQKRHTGLLVISAVLILVLLLGGTMTAFGFSGAGPLAFFAGKANAGVTPTATGTANGQPSPTPAAAFTPTPQTSATPTPTPTPDPNANPYPPHGGSLVLNDPLANNSQGNQWDESSDGLGNACRFSGGTYQVVRAPHYGGACFERANTFGDFTFQVEVTFHQHSSTQDSAGIVFRADPGNPGSNNYELALYASGLYFLAICRANGSGADCSQTVFRGTCHICHFGASQTNRLAIVARGTSFTFYVNGQKLASGTDSTYSQGLIGLDGSALNAPSIMAYRNARLWQ